MGKAGDAKCSVLVSQGTKREKTDYIEGKNLARLIMGNLISWLANRNGSPGQCVCELTISSGKKTEASKNAKKRTTQMHPQTQHKKSLYISPTHTKKM